MRLNITDLQENNRVGYVVEVGSKSDAPKPESAQDELQFVDVGGFHWRMLARTPVWRPPTDVFETEEAIIVRVEIAGMNEGDFQIELEGRSLSIRGVRPEVPERRAYHQMEIRFGEFSSEIELSIPVVADQCQAIYRNGFLRITLPKARAR